MPIAGSNLDNLKFQSKLTKSCWPQSFYDLLCSNTGVIYHNHSSKTKSSMQVVSEIK